MTFEQSKDRINKRGKGNNVKRATEKKKKEKRRQSRTDNFTYSQMKTEKKGFGMSGNMAILNYD